jgi:hypothetical protein
LATAGLSPATATAAPDLSASWSRDYTVPGIYELEIPADRIIQLDAIGGSGGATCVKGGSGTEASGRVTVHAGDRLQIVVGGGGSSVKKDSDTPVTAKGGFNGGGSSTISNPAARGGTAGGGGATEVSIIRHGAGQTVEKVLTAGGGGGAGSCIRESTSGILKGGVGGSDGNGGQADSWWEHEGGKGGRFGASGRQAGRDGVGGGGGGGAGAFGGTAGEEGRTFLPSGQSLGGGGGGAGGSDVWKLELGSVTVGTGTGDGRLKVSTIGLLPGTPKLSVSNPILMEGERTTLTAMLPPDAVGEVGFYDASRPGPDKGIGTAPIRDGRAELTVDTSAFGEGTEHAITASWGGDSNYEPGDSSSVTVMTRTPLVSVSPSASTITRSQQVTFTVTIEGAPSARGVVTLRDLSRGDVPLSVGPLTGGQVVIHVNGSEFGPGLVHAITATFDGGTARDAATSQPISVTVYPG